MKLSSTQVTKKLQQLNDEVKKLSQSTKRTLAKIKKVGSSISQKKDQSKIADLRKKIGL